MFFFSYANYLDCHYLVQKLFLFNKFNPVESMKNHLSVNAATLSCSPSNKSKLVLIEFKLTVVSAVPSSCVASDEKATDYKNEDEEDQCYVEDADDVPSTTVFYTICNKFPACYAALVHVKTIDFVNQSRSWAALKSGTQPNCSDAIMNGFITIDKNKTWIEARKINYPWTKRYSPR